MPTSPFHPRARRGPLAAPVLALASPSGQIDLVERRLGARRWELAASAAPAGGSLSHLGAELLRPATKALPSRLMKRAFPVSSLLNLLTASLGE